MTKQQIYLHDSSPLQISLLHGINFKTDSQKPVINTVILKTVPEKNKIK